MASHHVEWQQEFPRECRGGSAAIGKFDGVHLGHAALVEQAVVQARQVGGPAVVVTFDPHPLTLLRPEQSVSLLTTPTDRTGLLHHLGADHVLTLRTTHDLLQLPATDFFKQVLCRRLGVRGLVEGPNFRFGRGREGDIALLRRLCVEVDVELSVVAPVMRDGVEVSSGRIRAALGQGNVSEANRLLGRPYLLRGVVGTGQRRGRTIGFPTANLEQVTTVIPADGVYAARVQSLDGNDYSAAVNVGGNPTFAEQARKIEAHLIDYSGDLYGRSLAVEFVERLRDIHPFGSVQELIDQLGQDVARTREIVG